MECVYMLNLTNCIEFSLISIDQMKYKIYKIDKFKNLLLDII